MTDWAEVYRANVDAVTALAEGLPPEQLTTRVPASPDWTVQEVLAHLCGSPADALSGRMDGAPGPEWTGRHVAERASHSVADLVAELRAGVPAVTATLEDNDRPALVWNAAVHHADLHEALGKGAPPEQMWRPVVEALEPSLGEHAVRAGGRARLREVPDVLLPPLALPDRGLGHRAGPGDPRRAQPLRPPGRRPAGAVRWLPPTNWHTNRTWKARCTPVSMPVCERRAQGGAQQRRRPQGGDGRGRERGPVAAALSRCCACPPRSR